jgi:hypothetical protein
MRGERYPSDLLDGEIIGAFVPSHGDICEDDGFREELNPSYLLHDEVNT